MSEEFPGIPSGHLANKAPPAGRRPWTGARPSSSLFSRAPPPPARPWPRAEGKRLAGGHQDIPVRRVKRSKFNRVRTWRGKKGVRGALGKEAARPPGLRQAFAI